MKIYCILTICIFTLIVCRNVLQDNVFDTSPKYSIIFPVPPLTVNIPANFKITSFDEVHPFNFPVSLTPIKFGNFNSSRF